MKCARRRIGEISGDDQGYTLVELLVVLAILALMAGLVAPRALNYLSSAKSQTARLQIRNISAALDLYRLDVGRYPSKEQGLEALIRRPGTAEGWQGPYLPEEAGILDPWGQPYLYLYPGKHGTTDIFSLGADGSEGGEGEDADVLGWKEAS